jgi:hypothetical protein
MYRGEGPREQPLRYCMRAAEQKGRYVCGRFAAIPKVSRLDQPADSRPNPAAGNGIFGCGDRSLKFAIKMGGHPQRQKPGNKWSETN